MALARSLRVALVSDWYLPRIGGIETHIQDLALTLRAHGHVPHIITATKGPPAPQGLPVHRLDVPLLPGWCTLFRPRDLDPLRAVLLRHPFDVIHAHSLYSPLAVASMAIARRAGLPGVLTSHSLLPPPSRLALRALDRALGWSRWPDVLTAVSSVAADQTRRTTAGREVLILPNGIDPAAWPARRRAPPPRQRLLILSVMRLCRRKRPLDLVLAAARLRRLLSPQRAPQIHVLGDGPLRADLERAAARLGVADSISFLGARPRAQVRALLSDADAFVLPTIDEAFGIAVLEALSTGLPVVARREGGVRDLLPDGRAGLLTGSIDELAAALVRLTQDAALRAQLAREAPARARCFSWDTLIERYLAVYAAALGAHARPDGERPPLRSAA